MSNLNQVLNLLMQIQDPIGLQVQNETSFQFSGLATALGIGMGAIIFVLTAVVVWQYAWDKRNKAQSPRELLDEFCKAYGLNRRQRYLLKTLAHHRKLRNPNLLMINAELWEYDPKKDQRVFSSKNSEELSALQLKLFR